MNLDALPSPPGVRLLNWLKAFLSYGFILCVDDSCLAVCLDSFHKKGMDAVVIGEVIEENKLILQFKGAREILFDFDKESITGI